MMKWINLFFCQSAQMVHVARVWDFQLWGSGGQRSRSQRLK